MPSNVKFLVWPFALIACTLAIVGLYGALVSGGARVGALIPPNLGQRLDEESKPERTALTGEKPIIERIGRESDKVAPSSITNEQNRSGTVRVICTGREELDGSKPTPLAGVEVTLLVAGNGAINKGTTSRDGAVEFWNVSALRGRLIIDQSPYSLVDRAIEIPEVGSSELEFHVYLHRPQYVSGRVVDSQGSAVGGAIVRLIREGDQIESLDESTPDGKFILESEKLGLQALLVRKAGAGTAFLEGVNLFDENHDLGDLVLRSEARLAGRVLSLGGRPIGHCRIWGVHVSAIPNELGSDAFSMATTANFQERGDGCTSFSVQTDQLGEFDVEGLRAGLFMLFDSPASSIAHGWGPVSGGNVEFLLFRAELGVKAVFESGREPGPFGITISLKDGVEHESYSIVAKKFSMSPGLVPISISKPGSYRIQVKAGSDLMGFTNVEVSEGVENYPVVVHLSETNGVGLGGG